MECVNFIFLRQELAWELTNKHQARKLSKGRKFRIVRDSAEPRFISSDKRNSPFLALHRRCSLQKIPVRIQATARGRSQRQLFASVDSEIPRAIGPPSSDRTEDSMCSYWELAFETSIDSSFRPAATRFVTLSALAVVPLPDLDSQAHPSGSLTGSACLYALGRPAPVRVTLPSAWRSGRPRVIR